MMTSEQLYEIMTSRRHELNTFLMMDRSCEYTHLSNLLMDLVNTRNEPNMIYKLFTGTLGYEHNKQMALYHLPTIEFMSMIYSLQVLTDKYNVIELFSGMSLFSALYSQFTTVKERFGYPMTTVNAYDNNTWLETSSERKFYQTQKYSLERMIINRQDMKDSICIAIFPHKLERLVTLFLETCCPDCLVVVIPRNAVDEYMGFANNSQYKAICVNPKLITYFDMCYLPDGQDARQTRTIIYSKSDIHERSLQMISNEVLLYKQPITIKSVNHKADDIVSGSIAIGILPIWMSRLSINEKDEVLSELRRMSNVPRVPIMICDNVQTMDEFREYMTWKPSPPLTCPKQLFAQFRGLYRKLSELNGLEYLKSIGVFPSWIQNVNDAYDYLYLDYEEPTKQWKENENTFRCYFSV